MIHGPCGNLGIRIEGKLFYIYIYITLSDEGSLHFIFVTKFYYFCFYEIELKNMDNSKSLLAF